MTSSSEKFMFNTQREERKKGGVGVGGSRERDGHSNKEREKREDHNVSFQTSATTVIHQLKP